MKKYPFTILFLLVLLIPQKMFSQNNYTISGYISDKNSTERLIGASVIIEELNKGTITNNFGFYSLTLPAGNYQIRFGFVGYQPEVKTIKLSNDTVINVSLITGLKIKEVTVAARKDNPGLLESAQPGINVVSIETIKQTPTIAGENDVLKTLQFLPGIKQSQEGTSGINVRGGSPDQNLILLDGVPVYNVSHLFGFLSVFNADAINDVKILKGGIPARYGGRLASVLDITLKEGNAKKSGGIVSVSPVSGRIMLEGPIKKDTAAYMISARRTFLDIPLRIGLMLTQPVQAGYYFYDLSAKANWIISPKNRVYFSSYLGKDKYFIQYKDEGTSSKLNYNWGNITSVTRWNSEFSPKLFANFTGYYSTFSNQQTIKIKGEEPAFVGSGSWLNDYSLAADFDYYASLNHTFKFGAKLSYQTFSPQIFTVKGMEADTVMGKGVSSDAMIYSLYGEDEFYLKPLLRVNAGVRLGLYNTEKTNYFHFEPRVSARYLISSSVAVKASYTKMSQYLHLLSNSSIGMPTDLWVSSTAKTAPQESWQTSLGFYFKHPKNFELSIEGYYKEMKNVIRYAEGASFLSSRQKTWEDNIIVGEGNAYGVELLLTKTKGRLTGWVGYTLSWVNQKFPELNNGKPFPYRYDKRHDFSILSEYTLFDNGIDSKKFTFGFTFNTGYAASLPNVEHQGLNILTEKGDNGYLGMFDYFQTRVTYDSPNNFRMPAFHHLDIGYHSTRKLTKSRSRTWSYSVYNVYNRLNPWYYYKKDNKMRQVSIFPIIPSVSFTYKW